MTREVPMDAHALATLDSESYINLATFRRSGEAVETPVWFAARGGRLYVFTESRAGKVKRLRNDARVRIAPCGIRGKLKGAWIEGTARRIDDPELDRGAYEALSGKYTWQMRITDFISRLSGRIDQRAILELEV